MTVDEWRDWRAFVAAGHVIARVERPCVDCPADWRADMAVDGRVQRDVGERASGAARGDPGD